MNTVAEKRYDPMVLWASGTLMAAWGWHVALRELDYQPGHSLRLAATIAVVAAVGLVIIAWTRLFRSLDEYQQRVQSLALSIAFPVSVLAAFAVGFLRGEGWFTGADPRDLPIIMVLAYLVGCVIAWRRYR